MGLRKGSEAAWLSCGLVDILWPDVGRRTSNLNLLQYGGGPAVGRMTAPVHGMLVVLPRGVRASRFSSILLNFIQKHTLLTYIAMSVQIVYKSQIFLLTTPSIGIFLIRALGHGRTQNPGLSLE